MLGHMAIRNPFLHVLKQSRGHYELTGGELSKWIPVMRDCLRSESHPHAPLVRAALSHYVAVNE